ncbi:MAG TPA: cobalt-precorrin-5B (C(1))-methyltransferase [Candidatus Dormibacteraeota bacterium]|nr:cobalt-precorrin-5B (C(1))-methyltransferase [Candidatus Dormibacteraeota bacterium]
MTTPQGLPETTRGAARADEEGYTPAPRRKRGLRTGFTTGACSAAATRAASLHLVDGRPRDIATIPLPAGFEHTFTVAETAAGDGWTRAVVVKDAGDDPDVTHGARLTSTVAWRSDPGLELRGGEGVGTVTLPGLGLEVGGPAINPVPRRMITDAAQPAVELAQRRGCGVSVTIAVPGGEEMARRTLNARLGILGGISILGTTGIVEAFSTASWRASVVQAVDVAAANGVTHLVLSTGGRSESYARRRLPELPEMAFVEMGEFAGHALDRAREHGIRTVTLAGMVGKLTKLAQGQFQLHVAGGGVDPEMLAEVAGRAGADAALVERMRHANTARHAQEMALESGLRRFFDELCRAAAERCRERTGGTAEVEAWCFDPDSGELLGSAHS